MCVSECVCLLQEARDAPATPYGVNKARYIRALFAGLCACVLVGLSCVDTSTNLCTAISTRTWPLPMQVLGLIGSAGRTRTCEGFHGTMSHETLNCILKDLCAALPLL